jgi:arginase
MKRNSKSNSVVVTGVPWDEQSSFMRGCAGAPSMIREAYGCFSTNKCAENGHDLGNESRFLLVDDMQLSSGLKVLGEIESQALHMVNQGLTPLFLGGDHAVTYPLVKGVAGKFENLSILHFDAHPDLYDEQDGNRYGHGCPFARIMEENLVRRLVQVGIRTMNPHQKAQAERFGVEVMEMRNFKTDMILQFDGPVYLSLDLDVLDPAFAPGLSHHEPGGFTTRELISIIQNFKGNLIGADIVELNPFRDINSVTAMVAAKLMKEIAVRLLETE